MVIDHIAILILLSKDSLHISPTSDKEPVSEPSPIITICYLCITYYFTLYKSIQNNCFTTVTVQLYGGGSTVPPPYNSTYIIG